MKFLYLTVRNLWPRLIYFRNRQTDTRKQKGTQTDRPNQIPSHYVPGHEKKGIYLRERVSVHPLTYSNTKIDIY